MSAQPLNVAVLVELVRTPQSGGHMKCWEKLARAAAGVGELDLTVYVLGRRSQVDQVARNVRFVALPPVLCSAAVHGLIGGVDHADLAPFHRQLARRLPRHAVWHLTHCLAFAATAARLSRRGTRPLTASVHTDVPTLTGMYTGQVLERLPAPLRAAPERARLPDGVAGLARRRRDRILRRCRHILAANATDLHELAAVAPAARVGLLRRGVDTALFHPGRGDRSWLARQYGIPADQHLVLFAGRIDRTKGALVVADAVDRLRHQGVPAHLVLAGTGAAAGAIASRLGAHATLLGHLPQHTLARVYASCDVFAFPSRSETVGNVVAEAMAAGLPAVLPIGETTTQWLTTPGEDGVLVSDNHPATWAATLADLLATPRRRAAIGRHARHTIERRAPSWLDVLTDDLLPVWQAATAAGRPTPVGAPHRPGEIVGHSHRSPTLAHSAGTSRSTVARQPRHRTTASLP